MEAHAYHMTTSGAGSNEEESRIRVREDRTIARALQILQKRASLPGEVLGGATQGALFFRLLDRPGFRRHLRAIINGSERGVYGEQAVHG